MVFFFCWSLNIADEKAEMGNNLSQITQKIFLYTY